MKLQNRDQVRREAKKDYKRRLKEYRANNLHRESIAIPTPSFTPKLTFPYNPKPVSAQCVIPDFGWTPFYPQPQVDRVEEHMLEIM
jgi:hypothetical protein